MSLIKRPNSNNWYYVFQIQGRKYFGSTQTPKKTLAVKVEAKVREAAISRLVLGEVKPITLENALERYKRSKEATPNYKNIVSYGNKLLGFKLRPKSGRRIEVTPLAPAKGYIVSGLLTPFICSGRCRRKLLRFDVERQERLNLFEGLGLGQLGEEVAAAAVTHRRGGRYWSRPGMAAGESTVIALAEPACRWTLSMKSVKGGCDAWRSVRDAREQADWTMTHGALLSHCVSLRR